MTRSVLARKRAVARLAGLALRERFERLQDLAEALAKQPLLLRMAEEKRWEETGPLLKEWLKEFPVVDRFVLSNDKGVLTMDVPSIPGVRGKDFSYRDWYQGALVQTGKPYISEIFSRVQPPHEHQMGVAVLMKSDGGNGIGVLQLQVLMDSFLAWRKKIDAGPSGFVYFVDKNGHVAGHPNFPSQGEFADLSSSSVIQKMLRGPESMQVLLDPVTGEERVVAYKIVSPYGWGVVAEQPVRIAFAARDRSLRILLGIYALFFVFACLPIFLILRAETLLRRAEARFRLLVEAAPYAMLMADRQGTVSLVNSQAEALFGYRREEWIGKTIEMVVPARFRAKHPGQREGFFGDPRARPMGAGRDLFGLKKNGDEIPIEVGLNSIATPEGTFVLASIIDITERKHMEDMKEQSFLDLKKTQDASLNLMEDLSREVAERQRTEQKMQEAMAVKAEFTSMVSHELRTPLTVIKEGIGIVADQSSGPLNPTQIDYLQTAQRNVDRLSRLINDVLDFQRLETGQVEAHLTEQDINALVQESLKDLESFARQKGLRFVTELAEGLPKISLDKDRITQVLVNLVSNAVKFTEAGKGITVRTKREDNVIRINVQDEGVGIKAADLPKLFQSFSQIPVQGTRRAGGSGLGLAISKKIVELHQGRIGVESLFGRGSTFYFLLPIVERRGGA